MTKPLVDKGIFVKVADCPAPWPCFTAVHDEVLKNIKNTIAQILEITNIKKNPKVSKKLKELTQLLAEKYHQKIEDIQEWLSITEWSQSALSNENINKIQNQPFDLKLLIKKRYI
jgi:hypothetical protein